MKIRCTSSFCARYRWKAKDPKQGYVLKLTESIEKNLERFQQSLHQACGQQGEIEAYLTSAKLQEHLITNDLIHLGQLGILQ